MVSSDPQEATDVANSFATQFIQYRLDANQAILDAADQRVLAQLGQMTSAERASEEGKALTQFRNQLQNLSATQTGGFRSHPRGHPPDLLDLAAACPRHRVRLPRRPGPGHTPGLLVDYIDRRIKNEETMEKEFGLPVLASVPKVGRGWSSQHGRYPRGLIGFASADSPFLEAYRTLRSNLKFYQLEHRTQTLLVTSGLAREGKTVTAINLCLSLALSGARVILLEADLRRPMIDQYLNLDTRLGVSSVLAGTSTFSDSLQVVRVPDFVPDPRLRARGPDQGRHDAAGTAVHDLRPAAAQPGGAAQLTPHEGTHRDGCRARGVRGHRHASRPAGVRCTEPRRSTPTESSSRPR